MDTKITLGVRGMHCAACAKIIEKTVQKNPGVSEVNVNPLTEQAAIVYDPARADLKKINGQIKKLGYSFILTDAETEAEADAEAVAGKTGSLATPAADGQAAELKKKKTKLTVALSLTAVALIYMILTLAVPYFSPNTADGQTINKFFLPFSLLASTLILFWIGGNFISATGRFFRYGRANMDTLIGLGAGTAYLYSLIIYLFPFIRLALRLEEMYFFDVTIVVVSLVYLGKYLEAKAKLKTGNEMTKLISLQAKTAFVEKDGELKEVAIDDLRAGDIVFVKPAQKFRPTA